jgi:hypothetical protein
MLTYAFTTDVSPGLAELGGKALSVMAMTRRGLPVPPGFVLTTRFFEPWLATVQATPQWAGLLSGTPEGLPFAGGCDTVLKETSVWLGAGGGTYEEPSPARDRLCLTDQQVLALAGLIDHPGRKLLRVAYGHRVGVRRRQLVPAPGTAHHGLRALGAGAAHGTRRAQASIPGYDADQLLSGAEVQ